MTDDETVRLRELQNRIGQDIAQARTREEDIRLTGYWYDLNRLLAQP